MDGQNYVLQHISLNFLFFSSLFPVKSVIFVAFNNFIVNAEVQNIRVTNADGWGVK